MKHQNYMRLITLCTLLLSQNAIATDFEPGALLRCLAKEEASLHKSKRSGPQYKLNQLFFNEWAGNPSLELKSDSYKRVCEDKAHSASVQLLREFMLGGKSIFRSIKSLNDDAMAEMRRITLDELRRQMPQVFFTYIADLETFAPTAHCLEQKIAPLKPLREKYRYVESEISQEFLDNHKKEWREIFDGLEKWQQYFKECDAELKRKNLKVKS
ncbi:MAG: hypothetical protein CME71_08655 [Halobacteriovorax sp.]|nr:hypothetical protein [Halobacteriovorax sp.]